jgi:hypothetical protein
MMPAGIEENDEASNDTDSTSPRKSVLNPICRIYRLNITA